MTLEDFFTTEMKDGLTAPSRVQELIAVMQKEQDCVDKNAGDATRQWAAVASTIAATENKDCLDLFIQLDGLWFINRWLNDCKNFSADANDGFIEESITSMLRAIEKLHIDSKKSISSGIRVTVSNLLGHHSSKVQDKARLLFESWGGCENANAEPHDMDLDRIDNSSDKIVKEEGQPSSVNEAGNDDVHDSEIVVGEKSPLRSSDSLLPEKLASEQIQNSDHAFQPSVSLDCEDIKKTPNHPSSVLTSVQEVASMSDGVATSAETCNSPVPKPGSFKGEPDDLHLNYLLKEEKKEQIDNGSTESLGIPDISLSPTKPEPGPVSVGASETRALESVKEPALQHNVENNENGDCQKIIVSCNLRTPASDKKSGEDDVRGINSSSPQPSNASENDDYCSSNVLLGSSVSGRNVGKFELEMPFLKTEHVRAVKEGNGQVSNQGSNAPNDSDSFKRRKVPRSPKNVDKSSDIEIDYGIFDALEVAQEKGQVCSQGGGASYGSDSLKRGRRPRSPNIIDKSSNIELEYGIDDALAVARQVALEVEREARSSSSDKISEGGVRQPGSPDSIWKKDEPTHVLSEEVSSRQSNSTEASSGEEGHMSYSNNIEAEPECIHDLESSQVTEAARDPGGNSERSQCNFDLNEEAGSDDMDVSVAKSATPIPVVSALKPAQNSMMPMAPLQFEGTLGWKGSAATSAFRPASPWKNSDSGKNGSVDANSDLSKQRQDCLEFDLNVVEGDEELLKQIGESSGLPSGQSSVDLSPKGSSKLELDLNSIGDDGDTQPSDRRMEGQLFPLRNGYWSPSPASSSSSMQPSVRNIDLNDRPYFQTDLVEQGPPSKSSVIDSHGSSKSDAPMISILGAKVEVGRREHVPQVLSLPNGKDIEPAIDLTMSGAGGILGMAPSASYNNSVVFGYNRLSPAPPLSFSPVMYGSGSTMPYMVDSRGAPVVPQVGGSSSTVLSSYPQPPFLMSLADAPLGLNGVRTSRPNFDLNSDFMIDVGHRDSLAARQFFFPSSGRAMEEQARTIPQSSSSGAGGKRKEPESSGEPYPFSYKNPQPPWK